jgi:hypothetical protein
MAEYWQHLMVATVVIGAISYILRRRWKRRRQSHSVYVKFEPGSKKKN